MSGNGSWSKVRTLEYQNYKAKFLTFFYLNFRALFVCFSHCSCSSFQKKKRLPNWTLAVRCFDSCKSTIWCSISSLTTKALKDLWLCTTELRRMTKLASVFVSGSRKKLVNSLRPRTWSIIWMIWRRCRMRLMFPDFSCCTHTEVFFFFLSAGIFFFSVAQKNFFSIGGC